MNVPIYKNKEILYKVYSLSCPEPMVTAIRIFHRNFVVYGRLR